MDLSKAYDCIAHNLLIAKLEAYSFDRNCLKFIYSYLKDRARKVKVDSSYSSHGSIKIGIPQKSFLRPMLFNIFIYDLLLIDVESEICNFADDNTIFTRFNNQEVVKLKFEDNLCTSLKWFSNVMVANTENFFLWYRYRFLGYTHQV